MKSKKNYILLFGTIAMMHTGLSIGVELYPGNGNEPGDANNLIVYPDLATNVIKYNLGQKRHFYIRYSETIEPATFSADLNGKDISKKFHPVPGSEEDVFLHLKPGENELSIQVVGYNSSGPGAKSSYADLDTFIVKLNPPLTKANMLTTPPPSIETVELPPPAPATKNGKQPAFVIKK